MGNTFGSAAFSGNELVLHPYPFSEDEFSNHPGQQIKLVGVQNFPQNPGLKGLRARQLSSIDAMRINKNPSLQGLENGIEQELMDDTFNV